jgi:hypothetical protein
MAMPRPATAAPISTMESLNCGPRPMAAVESPARSNQPRQPSHGCSVPASVSCNKG